MPRALLVLLVLLLAACAPRAPEPGVFCSAGEWDLPPAYHGNPAAPGGVGAAGPYVYEPLFVYVSGTGEYLPRLGSSFTESPDGRTLTVHLRPGSRWHDGTPVTSRDVQCTFYLGYLKGLGIWSYLDSVDCPDDGTVVFTFHKPCPMATIDALTELVNLPQHLFGQHLSAVRELQKHGLYADPNELREAREVLFRFHPELPIGTGPFRIGRVTAAEMSLERFPEHPQADQVRISRIRLLRWGSNEVVWSYLLAGQVDAVSPACPPDVAEEVVRRHPSIRMLTPPDLADVGLLMNARRAPLDRLEVRRAVAQVLDRDLIRRVASPFSDTAGDLQIGMVQEVARRWLGPQAFQGLTPYRKDLQAAARQLQAGGYQRGTDGVWCGPAGPIHLELLAREGQNDLVLMAEAAAAQLEAFGIPTEIRAVKLDLYGARIKDGQFDLAATFGGQLGRYGDPALGIERLFYPGGQLQEGAGLPSMLDGLDTGALARGIRLERDPRQKREALGRMAAIAHRNLPFLSCFEKRMSLFLNDGERVTGWPPADDPIWTAAPGGIELLYATLLARGTVRPAGGP